MPRTEDAEDADNTEDAQIDDCIRVPLEEERDKDGEDSEQVHGRVDGGEEFDLALSEKEGEEEVEGEEDSECDLQDQ